MGCSASRCCCCLHSLCSFTILLFIFLANSSLLTEGRAAIKFSAPSEGKVDKEMMGVDRVNRIGSMPPRCDRKCSWCEPCEAIQVPANPQEGKPLGVRENSAGSFGAGKYYPKGRGDDDDEGSNYKPMSWKCKCGKFIFNP